MCIQYSIPSCKLPELGGGWFSLLPLHVLSDVISVHFFKTTHSGNLASLFLASLPDFGSTWMIYELAE